MRSLNAAEIPLHLETIFQFAFRDALLESRERFFDLGHKATTDGLLFLLPSHRTAEDVGLLPAQNLDLLDLPIWEDLLVIVFPQLGLDLLRLLASSAHQL